MKTSRRTFVKTGALAAVGTALLPYACASSPKKVVGLQLYSVREDMGKDPVGTMKQLAAMGWVHVEHANYIDRKFYGYEAKEFRKILDDLGLKMVSGHTVMGSQHWDAAKNDFSDSWKYTIDDAAVLGQQYVVSPSMDESMRSNYDDFRRYMDIFNKCGDLCHRQGMKFGYHNHDFEFSESLNGEKLFDIMMKSMDPAKVVVQLDIGNLYNGGAIAIDVVKQYPGRFENVHVKDEIMSEGGGERYESTILGKGIVDCRNVVDTLTRIGGTTCYIVEQESYQGMTPLESVREDLAVMKQWGY